MADIYHSEGSTWQELVPFILTCPQSLDRALSVLQPLQLHMTGTSSL